MKLTTLLFIAILAISCAKEKTAAPAPTQTSTFAQDLRFTGTWVADSSSDGNTTNVGGGTPEMGDSVIFSLPSFNGAVPVPEIKSWYTSTGSPLQLPTGYFWETTNDSLFFKAGNHVSGSISYRFWFNINGNRLETRFSETVNTNQINRFGYYHKL